MTAAQQEPLARDEGFELFRRAIAQRDALAWADVHARYRQLLISWARQSSVALPADEEYADVADQALARAWSALTPDRFAAFPALPALLGYMRSCVSAVLIDMARARASRERAMQRLSPPDTLTPEELVLGQLDRDRLWRVAESACESQQERVVLLENFVYGIPPRRIAERHPRLFDGVSGVYAAQRNLKARLQRNLELRRLRDELGGG